MARYWLTPVTAKEPLTLGAGRLICEPQEELERLRELLAGLHPRLLPLFKASLLPGDDADACGSEEAEPDWAGGRDIRFDGLPLTLSHCGEAFIDRLLSPREALALLGEAGFGAQSNIAPQAAFAEGGERLAIGMGLDVMAATAAAEGAWAGSGGAAGRWFGVMAAWLAAGCEVILLREDGSFSEVAGCAL